MRRIAIVNTGASTLKLALMEVSADGVHELERVAYDCAPGDKLGDRVLTALEAFEEPLDVIGHRVVHGGSGFIAPTTLTQPIEHALEALLPLAPLHNGPALSAIRATRQRYPDIPAVAVFDTAFHAQRPAESMQYALPQNMVETFSVRRYGFHGIAHESLLHAVAEAQGLPVQEVSAVTLQLGAGCSACAIREGRSIETSMGFTPLEGLVMATRSGDVDPAIALRLMRAGYDAERIENLLTRASGLLGLCGLADMRQILAAESRGEAAAQLALRLFCHRIILAVGAYFTLLGGKGALVFGGGIGANAPEIRKRIARGLAAWNVVLDSQCNRQNQTGRISASDSRPVFAFRTNEEAIIAREVMQHLGA